MKICSSPRSENLQPRFSFETKFFGANGAISPTLLCRAQMWRCMTFGIKTKQNYAQLYLWTRQEFIPNFYIVYSIMCTKVVGPIWVRVSLEAEFKILVKLTQDSTQLLFVFTPLRCNLSTIHCYWIFMSALYFVFSSLWICALKVEITDSFLLICLFQTVWLET